MLKDEVFVATLSKGKIGALDGLRGLAAMVVVVFHFSPGWAGYLAVDFFFVLSGFIISYSYIYRRPSVGFYRFTWSRLIRLYPLHVFTIGLFALSYYTVEGGLPSYKDGNFQTLIQHITLMQNVGLSYGGVTWNYPSWSISVEFWVGLAFFWLVSPKTGSLIIISVSAICLVAIVLNYGHLDVYSKNIYGVFNSGLLRGAASFGLGLIAYRLYLLASGKKLSYSFVTVCELLSCFIVLVVVFIRGSKYSVVDIMAPFSFLLLVLCFSLERGFLSKIASYASPLGEISYSIYLNHIPILMIVHYVFQGVGVPTYIVFIIYISVVLVFSKATYVLVERPSRAWGRRAILRIYGKEDEGESELYAFGAKKNASLTLTSPGASAPKN